MAYELLDDEPTPQRGGFTLIDEPPQKPRTLGQKINQFAGNVAAGGLRGAGSIGATLMAPLDEISQTRARPLLNLLPGVNALVAADNAFGRGTVLGRDDRRMAMDAALGNLGAETDSLAYKGGKLGAEIAGTAGAGGALANALRGGVTAVAPSFLPKFAPFLSAVESGGLSLGNAGTTSRLANAGMRVGGGALTGGATAGLVNPEDAPEGALVGALMPGVVKTLGETGRAIGRQFVPSGPDASLAKAAIEKGAPLGIADVSKGSFTRATRAILNDAPLTGPIGAAQSEAKQKWFNRAVGEVFDAADDKLTPEVMDAAKKRMGAEFDRIWGTNSLVVDDAMLNSLQAARKNAAMLPKGERSRIASLLDDFEGQVTQNADGQMVIPGDVANRYQSKIREISESSTGFLKNDMSQLRKDILAGFGRSVSPEDAAALAVNQSKYKAFKTVAPLLEKGELGIAGREAGDVPAGLLPQAVYQSYKGGASKSPLAELSKIGSQFMVDRVPQTGGSTRALIQNSAIGSALGLGALSNPFAAALTIPAAMGINKALGSPALARSLLNSNAPQVPMGLLQFIQRSAPVIAAQ